MNRPIIAVFASGQGTTAEAFIRASTKNVFSPQIGLVICNKAEAGIFARVEALNTEFGLKIVCQYISKSNYPPVINEIVKPGEQSKAE